MDEKSVVMLGILNADGTLELDGRPDLAAGRVEVTIRSLSEQPEAMSWWAELQRTRAKLEASGHGFRTKEEIDADIEDMRDWDGRIDEIHRQIEEERRRIEKPEEPSRTE